MRHTKFFNAETFPNYGILGYYLIVNVDPCFLTFVAENHNVCKYLVFYHLGITGASVCSYIEQVGN